jgi:hypothetical protein
VGAPAAPAEAPGTAAVCEAAVREAAVCEAVVCEAAPEATLGGSAGATDGSPVGAEAAGLASVTGGVARSRVMSGCDNAQDANSSEQQAARTQKPDPDDLQNRICPVVWVNRRAERDSPKNRPAGWQG